MTDENNRGNERAETAKRHDDSELIEGFEDAPSQQGRSGHNLHRDIGTRDELEQTVGDSSITRVRASDKEEQADLPRFNQGSSKLNP